MPRKIIIKLSEGDYHIFARIANESGLSAEEKLQEIVDIYIIIEKKRFKQNRLKYYWLGLEFDQMKSKSNFIE